MNTTLSILIISALLIIGGCATQTVDNKGVQTAMNDFIQAKLSADSMYTVADQQTTFDYLHDGVKEKDGLFVSCADFKAGDDIIDVDYYVKETNGNYEVVKEVYHKKNGVEVNEVLGLCENEPGC